MFCFLFLFLNCSVGEFQGQYGKSNVSISIKCAKLIESSLKKDSHSLQFLVGFKVGYGSYTSMPEVIQGKKQFPEWDVKFATYKRAGRWLQRIRTHIRWIFHRHNLWMAHCHDAWIRIEIGSTNRFSITFLVKLKGKTYKRIFWYLSKTT